MVDFNHSHQTQNNALSVDTHVYIDIYVVIISLQIGVLSGIRRYM